MMTACRRGGALMFALLLAAGAQAGTRTTEAVQLDTTQPSVEAQVVQIESALSSEHYSELTPEDKAKVRAALNRIRVTMGDKRTVEELAPIPRMEVGNDQAVVNTLLTQAHADSRMVCRRERSIGSNFPQQQCMTVGQRRRTMETSQDGMLRHQRASQQR